MKTRAQEATLRVEYLNLSKRGMLSAYDWFVVRIEATTPDGRTIVLREDQFGEKKPAREAYDRYRRAVLG